jgi:hypothetical protein
MSQQTEGNSSIWLGHWLTMWASLLCFSMKADGRPVKTARKVPMAITRKRKMATEIHALWRLKLGKFNRD